ncbi:MAG: NAD-dependent deacylase [Pseudomonadota bacterium]
MARIVVLTGAGVSAESGLGTFRDKGGLWSKYDLAEVATPEGFAQNPGLVHEFYNARRANAVEAAPNDAHHALARLEAGLGEKLTLITQNIDTLHEAAGSTRVFHMHGRIDQALCAACGHRWMAPLVMAPPDPCPDCRTPATRPDIVWFGEMPYWMDEITEAVARADLFVSIGTSGEVYPAAGFVAEAKAIGAQTLELNMEASGRGRLFDTVRLGPATQTVPAWVAEMLGPL